MDRFVVVKFSKFFHVLTLILCINNLWHKVEGDSDHGRDLMGKMKKIKDKILKDYDQDVRPIIGDSNSTSVSFGMGIREIIEMDEERGLLTMDGFLVLTWTDPRLMWNKTDYDGYLQLPEHYLWKPDISVFNSHSAAVDPTHWVLIFVDWNGQVVWVPPIMTTTYCPSISEKPYPNDEIECMIEMGSWTHDGWEIDFKVHEFSLFTDEFYNINPRWELDVSKVHTLLNVTYYECCPEPYHSIHTYLPLKRKPVPEIEATRAPCIMVMILTLSIFWMPPDSSKKLLLAGISFLVLNILLVYVGYSTRLPTAAFYATSFLRSTMYVVISTLILQVIILNVSHLSGPSRPPASMVLLLSGPLGKYACLWSPKSSGSIAGDRVQLKEDGIGDNSPSPNDEWLLMASAMDRLFFVIMAIAMIAVHKA